MDGLVRLGQSMIEERRWLDQMDMAQKNAQAQAAVSERHFLQQQQMAIQKQQFDQSLKVGQEFLKMLNGTKSPAERDVLFAKFDSMQTKLNPMVRELVDGAFTNTPFGGLARKKHEFLKNNPMPPLNADPKTNFQTYVAQAYERSEWNKQMNAYASGQQYNANEPMMLMHEGMPHVVTRQGCAPVAMTIDQAKVKEFTDKKGMSTEALFTQSGWYEDGVSELKIAGQEVQMLVKERNYFTGQTRFISVGTGFDVPAKGSGEGKSKDKFKMEETPAKQPTKLLRDLAQQR